MRAGPSEKCIMKNSGPQGAKTMGDLRFFLKTFLIVNVFLKHVKKKMFIFLKSLHLGGLACIIDKVDYLR